MDALKRNKHVSNERKKTWMPPSQPRSQVLKEVSRTVFEGVLWPKTGG